MHFPRPDAKQDSLGMIGLIGLVYNIVGFSKAGSSHETACFLCCFGFREQRGSKYFSPSGPKGASFTLSSREQGGRRFMDYSYNNSDDEAHTSNRKDKVGGEEEEETEGYSQGDSVRDSQIKNSSENLDPLTEAFNSFHSLQEVLKKEIQKFQELGKEISSLHDGGESSSCIHAGHEQASEASSSLDSEILNLMKNVENLEIKLEEAKCIIEVKESQIRELESTISFSEPHTERTDIKIEEIFQQKMAAEIEYIIFSRSVANLNRRIKLVEGEMTLAENDDHKLLSKLGEAGTKAENLKNQAQGLQKHCVEIQEVKNFKKRLSKTTSCLLLQLGLLLMLLCFQLMPESEIVVPT